MKIYTCEIRNNKTNQMEPLRLELRALLSIHIKAALLAHGFASASRLNTSQQHSDKSSYLKLKRFLLLEMEPFTDPLIQIHAFYSNPCDIAFNYVNFMRIFFY